MKKLILFILLFPVLAWAGPGYMVYDSNAVPAAPFCTGGTLFCADFETQDMIDWDTISGGAEDCDGYDADGDWCDYEGTTVKNGSRSFGIRGSGGTYYFREALSSTATELYAELWFQTNSGANSDYHILIFEDSSNKELVSVRKDADYGLNAACNGTTWDAGNGHILAETWVHIGLHYKEETGAGNKDGIVRVWLETDGDGFEAGELLVNQATVDTLSADVAKIRLSGTAANKICYRDDVKVTSGTPSWPTE